VSDGSVEAEIPTALKRSIRQVWQLSAVSATVRRKSNQPIRHGLKYAITQKWQAFVDLKQLWLSVNADGLLGGFTAVSAKVKLDPTIISAGIKFRFD
jgi:outer membrane protein W